MIKFGQYSNFRISSKFKGKLKRKSVFRRETKSVKLVNSFHLVTQCTRETNMGLRASQGKKVINILNQTTGMALGHKEVDNIICKSERAPIENSPLIMRHECSRFFFNCMYMSNYTKKQEVEYDSLNNKLHFCTFPPSHTHES